MKQDIADNASNEVLDSVVEVSDEGIDTGMEDVVDEESTTSSDEGNTKENTSKESSPKEDVVTASDKVDTTKQYSERLNKDREKIKLDAEKAAQDKLDNIAIKKGFADWKELEDFSEQQKLESLGVADTEGFKSYVDEVISKNPVVVEAQAIIKHQEEERKNEIIKTQILEINKINPNIKTFDDLTKLDKYSDFYEKIEKGYDISDAYKIVYFNDLRSKDLDTARKTALNNIDSKSHLKNNAGGASSVDVHIPAEVMAMYRRNIPNMTEAEIRKHYNKFVEDQK